MFLTNFFLFSFQQVTQAGDYVLAIASIMLSRLKHDEVTLMLSQVSNFDLFLASSHYIA